MPTVVIENTDFVQVGRAPEQLERVALALIISHKLTAHEALLEAMDFITALNKFKEDLKKIDDKGPEVWEMK